MNEVELIAADLSPGDAPSAALDWTGLTPHRVAGADDPLFERAYQFLSDEFAPRHEVEHKDVLIARFNRNPTSAIDGRSFLYEMILVLRGDELAAVRDHTAIVPHDRRTRQIVVHLSHLLVAKPWRGTGLAGWMRALPIQTARRAARLAGFKRRKFDVVLLAEMESPDSSRIDTLIRLKSYQRAGFLKVDPYAIAYRQPDFRPLTEIDATGVRPLPMALILRRLGRETETSISGNELKHLVRSLYAMYGLELRRADMADLFSSIDFAGQSTYRLIPPADG